MQVLVPVLYLVMSALLRTDVMAGNMRYFWMFADLTDAEFLDGINGNLYAVVVEVVVFLGLECAVRVWTKFSLFEFAGITISMDFSYWLSVMAPAYIVFNLIQEEHGGFHPLMRWVDGLFAKV